METKSPIKHRIKTFIEQSGKKPRDFQKQTGIPYAVLRQLNFEISLDKLLNILKAYPELNTDWILFGDLPIYKKDEGIELAPNEEIVTIPKRELKKMQEAIKDAISKANGVFYTMEQIGTENDDKF